MEQRAQTLDERLERKVAALRKYRGTIRFFKNRRSLLSRSDRRCGELVARVREEARSPVDEDDPVLRARSARERHGGLRHCRPSSDLQRLRVVLPGGARRRPVRVAPVDERAERPVPRAVPDGLVRARAVRPRRRRPANRPSQRTGTSSARVGTGAHGAAAGRRRRSRSSRSGRSADLELSSCVSFRRKLPACAPRAGFLGAAHLVGVPATCGDSGSATAFGPSMRLLHTRAVTASATRTSAS